MAIGQPDMNEMLSHFIFFYSLLQK